MPQKVCRQCLVEKDEEDFTFSKRHGKVINTCRKCMSANTLAWKRANPDSVKATRRMYRRAERCKKYGLTEDEFLFMETAQQGLCRVCQEFAGGDLHIDHNHETGEVRGLLCSNCNTAIGLMHENPKILFRAIQYLAKTRETSA